MDTQVHGWIKAAIALVMAILAALATAVTGKEDFADVDTRTWLIALGAVIASGALVAFVENVWGLAGGIIKAVIGAFGAAITSLVVGLDDQVLTQVEMLTALSAFVAGLSLVYQVPEPSTEEPEPVPEPPRPTQLPA